MATITQFEDLEVWRIARKLKERNFKEHLKSFHSATNPKRETLNSKY